MHTHTHTHAPIQCETNDLLPRCQRTRPSHALPWSMVPRTAHTTMLPHAIKCIHGHACWRHTCTNILSPSTWLPWLQSPRQHMCWRLQHHRKQSRPLQRHSRHRQATQRQDTQALTSWHGNVAPVLASSRMAEKQGETRTPKLAMAAAQPGLPAYIDCGHALHMQWPPAVGQSDCACPRPRPLEHHNFVTSTLQTSPM